MGNKVLKEYLLRGYAVNSRIAALEQHATKQEVTIELNGVRVRVNIATKSPNMEITLIEVKNGPYANFTPNQKIVYPQMMLDHAPIVPIGQNAAEVWPQIGQPTINYVFIIIKIY